MRYTAVGGDTLDICVFDMPSYTYAVKGQRLLRARGYPCSVRRRSGGPEKGCGFSLNIAGSCSKAAEILDLYGLPYVKAEGGGADNDKL